MFVQNFVKSFFCFFVVRIKVENVTHDIAETFVRKELQMFDNVDDLARRVRVGDLEQI